MAEFKTYKPGQLITKRVDGINRVFRIAKRKSCDSACNRCIIIRKVWHYASSFYPPICKWCEDALGPNLYLKNP